MSTTLLIVAIIAAVSLCPAMMWWNARRGRRGCVPSGEAEDGKMEDLDGLRREQDSLAARIAELEREPPAAGAKAAETAP